MSAQSKRQPAPPTPLAKELRERIARDALVVLPGGGRLVLECGDGQAAAVASGLRSLGYDDVLCTPDLAGRDRVVDARWRGQA